MLSCSERQCFGAIEWTIQVFIHFQTKWKLCKKHLLCHCRNVTELKAYLGLLYYYHRLLPNLSIWLAPLHNLLRESVKWHWGSEQHDAFEKSKPLIQSSEVLVHYDTQKDLILACDASSIWSCFVTSNGGW